MKLKSILASVAACAIGVSAMALTASAQVTNGNTTGDDGKLFTTIDVVAEGVDLASVYGFKVEMTMGDLSEGCGGGCGYNSPSTSWKSAGEWGNEGSNKAIIFDANGDFTYTSDTAFFTATEEYAQVWIQNWWGCDVTVDKVTLLGKDGKALGAAATTTTTAAAGTTAGTTAAAAGTTTAGGTATGDAGIALAAAGVLLAGTAAFVTRKKH